MNNYIWDKFNYESLNSIFLLKEKKKWKKNTHENARNLNLNKMQEVWNECQFHMNVAQ